MFEKLKTLEQKYIEISEKLSQPDIVSDNKLYTQLMKDFKNMTPIIEKYREYKKALESFEEAQELLSESGLEKDFREMAQSQYEEA
ncbi:MAG: PCRF domain-containing protein, partial [Ruminococcus sp.]|nr:PCRF domain-containing protein [Ruminococcus sp.]